MSQRVCQDSPSETVTYMVGEFSGPFFFLRREANNGDLVVTTVRITWGQKSGRGYGSPSFVLAPRALSPLPF